MEGPEGGGQKENAVTQIEGEGQLMPKNKKTNGTKDSWQIAKSLLKVK